MPGSPKAQQEIKARDISLTPDQQVGISRLVPAKFGERWRARFTNGKVADSWAELKYAVCYTIPMYSNRPESQG